MDRCSTSLIAIQRMIPDDRAWLFKVSCPEGFTCLARGHERACAQRVNAHILERASSPADIDDGGDDSARHKVRPDDLVLERLSHGHPFHTTSRRCNCRNSLASARTGPPRCRPPTCPAQCANPQLVLKRFDPKGFRFSL